MTYKEKHKLKIYAGAALIGALSLLPTSCQEDIKKIIKHKDNYGLLNSDKEIVEDKYGKKIEVEQVNILVYNNDGSLKENYAVLSRGNTKSKYKPSNGDVNVRQAYINNSEKSIKIGVREDFSVVTADGFNNLFWDSKTQKVVLVADENINDFIRDNQVIFSLHNSSQKNKKSQIEDINIEEKTNIIQENHINDTIAHDSVHVHPDSVTYDAEQFTDTLRMVKHMKEKEI